MSGADLLGGAATGAEDPIIATRDVMRYFSVGHGGFGRGRTGLKAVDGVSVSIRRGETLALVGETGSGKTTFGRLLLGLYKPTGGDILYRGSSVLDPRSETARTVRRHIPGRFHDPYAAPNARVTFGQTLAPEAMAPNVFGQQARAWTPPPTMHTAARSPTQS